MTGTSYPLDGLLGRVRAVDRDGVKWWAVTDLCGLIGSTNPAMDAKRIPPEHKAYITLATPGGPQRLLVTDYWGVRLLLGTSRSPASLILRRQLGLLPMSYTQEARHIGVIEAAFRHLGPVRQFGHLGYRIDLYFPAYRLAVECDEHGHSGKEEADRERQARLEASLGCRFIRFNPDVSGFNVGDVIREIMLAIG